MNATATSLQYVFQGKFIVTRVLNMESHCILVDILTYFNIADSCN